MSSLQDLPLEIIAKILGFLDANDYFKARQSCKYINNSITWYPKKPKQRATKLDFWGHPSLPNDINVSFESGTFHLFLTLSANELRDKIPIEESTNFQNDYPGVFDRFRQLPESAKLNKNLVRVNSLKTGLEKVLSFFLGDRRLDCDLLKLEKLPPSSVTAIAYVLQLYKCKFDCISYSSHNGGDSNPFSSLQNLLLLESNKISFTEYNRGKRLQFEVHKKSGEVTDMLYIT